MAVSPAPGLQASQTVFISYNREDAVAAGRLRDWLRDEGLDVFMDTIHLTAGEPWLLRLRRAVAEARAFIVLMRSPGPRGFVRKEVGWALERRRRAVAAQLPQLVVFPVCLDELIEGQVTDPLMHELLKLNVTRWNRDGTMPAPLLAALRATLPDVEFHPEHPPFRGLATFDERDAEWFFGRNREIHEVIDAAGSAPGEDGLVERAASEHHRCVLICGDSGSGKSSLLRAGVLPLLRSGALWPRTGLRCWRIAGPLRPGADPIGELERALVDAFAPPPAVEPPPDLRRALREDRGALARILVERSEADTGIVLVVDQLEELLQSAVDARERRQFARLLFDALQLPACPLYVMGTVRADGLAELDARLPELHQARTRFGTTYALPRITESGLRLTIEEPARRARIDVSEVVDLLLEEAQDEPGALALVQHAAWSLWRTAHRRERVTRLLRSDHDAAGGLAGMLSHDADAALAAVKARVGTDQGALQLLCRMTWVGEDDRLFRRRVDLAEAEREAGQDDPKEGAAVIEVLSSGWAVDDAGSAARAAAALPQHLPLVVTGRDAAGAAWVELVHEMLLRVRQRPGEPPVPHWQRLHDFIQQRLERLKLEQRLQADVQDWQRLGAWMRWRRLASRKEQRLFAALPRSRDAGVRWYLALSRLKSASTVAMIVAPALYFAIGGYQLLQHGGIFPAAYMTKLPLWLAGLGAEPEFVRLPGTRATFDFGCDVARDTVGRVGCEGFLPLRRGFEAPITCDMGRHEVSFEQFDRYVFIARRQGRAALAYPSPEEHGRGDLPVMEVSRAEAQAYAAWLTARSGGKTRYRLPAEWEWEYAARAGSTGPYPWGADAPAGHANFDDGVHPTAPQPVRSGTPNAFGLYHVVGNASEWVADTQDPLLAGMPRYVARGGAYSHSAPGVRIAARQSLESDLAGNAGTPTNIGFRLCRER